MLLVHNGVSLWHVASAVRCFIMGPGSISKRMINVSDICTRRPHPAHHPPPTFVSAHFVSAHSGVWARVLGWFFRVLGIRDRVEDLDRLRNVNENLIALIVFWSLIYRESECYQWKNEYGSDDFRVFGYCLCVLVFDVGGPSGRVSCLLSPDEYFFFCSGYVK